MLSAALIFFTYAAVSLTWWAGDKTLPIVLLVSLAAAFFAGLKIESIERVWKYFLYWISINVVIAVIQYVGVQYYGVRIIDFATSAPAGLYSNSNFLGAVVAIALAGAMSYRFFWFTPVGVLGLILAESRAGFITAGCIALVSLWRHNKTIAAMLAIGTLVSAWQLSSGRSEGSTLIRLGVWQDTLNHLTFFGSGWGSFFDAYGLWPRHTNATLIHANHAYNDVLEMLFELGIGSVALWFLIAFAFERGAASERLICIAFAVLGITYFPLFIFPLGQLFAMTLGQMTRRAQMGSATTENYNEIQTQL